MSMRDLVMLLTFSLIASAPAFSQGPTQPAPQKVYSGNLSAGFALTGGNTDTATYNLGFELARDPGTNNIVKLSGLYLRSDKDSETITDRLRLAFRDEFTISDRTFIYGDFHYLRSPFRQISYLINPQGGIGYKLLSTDRATLALDGGGGVAWEKNPGFDANTSGTLNAGQSLSLKLSGNATLTQTLTGLWKTENFSDTLYHFGIALSTSITSRAELKVEFMDDYKNVTPAPEIKKNDTAFITSFLFKF